MEHLGKRRKSTNRNTVAIASSSADNSALCEHNKICGLLCLRTLELEPSDDIQLTNDSESEDFDEGPRTTERRIHNIDFLLRDRDRDVDTAT